MTRDPDWFTPHTDDYTATYGADDGDPADECDCGEDDCSECEDGPTVADEYADVDTTIRYTIERGRPGYAYPDED